MPKMKSKSAAKKRFSATASGRFKRSSAFRRHLLTRKSPKRKCQLRQITYISGADQAVVARLLPYA